MKKGTTGKKEFQQERKGLALEEVKMTKIIIAVSNCHRITKNKVTYK